ncbi:putative signal transducing protein [Carboxylicivirga sp. N1Y90]|uniref:putative signal transducing protein n=1 Tax=Carboxylicivirga fragile TaxID=3417571 RepID=UPI003D33030E|nr:DUF2007 domain-containing protein [Marinilabiliaceae bacterium N1Y90]
MSQADSEKLVVVYEGNPVDADIVKQMLANHNIEANILNQFTSTIAPHIVPEASVIVMEKHKADALVLLQHFSTSN